MSGGAVSGVTMAVLVSGVTMAVSVSGVTESVLVSGVTVSVLGVTMADAAAWRISLLERRGLRRQPRILVREPPVREPWVREPRVREPWVREPWVREPWVREPRALALGASRREGPILHWLSDDYRWEEWSPRDTGRNLLSRRALLNPSRLIDAKQMSGLGH